MNHFSESLKASHAASDLPIWETIYRAAFANFATMIDHRQDGEHQRAGIDRSVVLTNSKQILIDEKVRYRDYADIALEFWSVYEQRVPGWVVAPLRADYIAYAILPRGVCHLLPVIQLQAAWARNGTDWLRRFGKIQVPNRDYHTHCCCVPPGLLYPAIGSCLRVRFDPREAA